ncbi:MAG: methyltransferase [Dehalococcoidia bacterium]|jgi:regulator of RNase E activity RraA|nr:methyltransferase [Dehalococcoidia bacterium]MQG15602.1 RraA family protein [SAR202 cluster bacterium]|tara:strand:+ start:197 stop:856 length:660 start_codon:yes stop_codon:yes gene_type:complete
MGSKNLDLTNRLQKCYTGAVYDAMRELGLTANLLSKTIRPLDNSLTLAGPVWTFSGTVDTSISDDESLMSWTKLLSDAPSGMVMIGQPNDSSIAHMGELSVEALRLKGVLGYVVDGGCRDCSVIVKQKFPVFCKYMTPSDVVGKWKVTSMAEAIEIDGVEIFSGDYMIGDMDGIIIIRANDVEKVVERSEYLVNTETELRKAILKGMDPLDAYLKYRVF